MRKCRFRTRSRAFLRKLAVVSRRLVFRLEIEAGRCSDERDRSQQTPVQYRPDPGHTDGRNVAHEFTIRVPRVLIHCTFVYNGSI